jgi:hypothetical protein
MRIKIIGENNCARATRHLLRLAGFAVTEFLPADAVAGGLLAGFAITIDLAPAPHTPDPHLRPDHPTHHQQASASEEAPRLHRDASSPSFTEAVAASGAASGEPTAGKSSFAKAAEGTTAFSEASAGAASLGAIFKGTVSASIHFDSVDSALEAAVLRHVTQLAAAPVIVDRPGGVVHSDRELRIIAPNTGDSMADEAAAVAIEFGVLRGLLDLAAPAAHKKTRGTGASKNILSGDGADEFAEAPEISRGEVGKRKWWPFGIVLIAGALGLLRASIAAEPARTVESAVKTRVLKPVLLAAAEPQGQFATGQGLKITDGTNFLVVDPCKAQMKLYASISQTANAQVAAGTAVKKIYVCSIHVVAAEATNVAVVEGTGSVCGTSTAGVSGFGGAAAATGWNFAANGGIVLGNGDSFLGAEGASGDNLCIFNSGSGQVSGGISYVVE